MANYTRLSKTYIVGILGRYTDHNPSNAHWSALKRLSKYHEGTVIYGIHHSSCPVVVKGFSDANWISDYDETKSISG